MDKLNLDDLVAIRKVVPNVISSMRSKKEYLHPIYICGIDILFIASTKKELEDAVNVDDFDKVVFHTKSCFAEEEKKAYIWLVYDDFDDLEESIKEEIISFAIWHEIGHIMWYSRLYVPYDRSPAGKEQEFFADIFALSYSDMNADQIKMCIITAVESTELDNPKDKEFCRQLAKERCEKIDSIAKARSIKD